MPNLDRTSTLELLQFSKDLPSLPDRFVNIQKIAQDPDSSAHDLAEIIRSDQSTTVMILKFANSPAYNPSGTPVSELSKAIARIGLRNAIQTSTAISLMYGLILPTGMANIRIFWAHAFAVALVAEHIAKQTDPGQQQNSHEAAFMAGLMHDIGRAALGMRVDFAYFERETGHLHDDALIHMEKHYYGIDHAEVGSHLLHLWQFPDKLCQAVADHHQPDSPNLLARICYLANQYTNEHFPERTPFDDISDIITTTLHDTPPDLTSLTTQ